MARIDPAARIAAGARIADDVEVGPYCIIGPSVELKAGVRLQAHVNISGMTTIGEGTIVYPFASLGTPPQSVHYRGGATRLVVGANCQIREGVTMNTGTEDGGGVTSVGDQCFVMVGAHVAHDCHVGNHVVFANNVTLAGHVEIGDHVFLGGQTGVHQFVRIGEGAMIGAFSPVREDVIPFGYALYPVSRLVGLNLVGMRRRGLSRADIAAVRSAYKALFEGDGEFTARVERVASEYGSVAPVAKIIAFIRSAKRPVLMTAPRGGDTLE